MYRPEDIFQATILVSSGIDSRTDSELGGFEMRIKHIYYSKSSVSEATEKVRMHRDGTNMLFACNISYDGGNRRSQFIDERTAPVLLTKGNGVFKL